jgi:hypothetical protein
MLKHFNVVREFQTLPLKREDSLTMPINPKAGDDLEVVIYVQRKNMKIVNAVKVAVEQRCIWRYVSSFRICSARRNLPSL